MHANLRYVKLARVGLILGVVLLALPARARAELVARTQSDALLAVAPDDPRVEGLVRANLRALGAMLDDPALGAEHVGRLLPAADDARARDFYERYVGSRFKADGRPDPDVVARALPLVAEELRIITGRAVDVPPAGEIYRSDLTAAWTP